MRLRRRSAAAAGPRWSPTRGSMQVGHRRHRHRQRAGVHEGARRSTSGNLDDLAQPNTILLFEEQAKKLDVKVGDAITISAPTTRGTNNTIDVPGGGHRRRTSAC